MENIDWSALGFDYTKTDFNARFTFTDGKWSEMEITSDEYIKMHMSASCLHYGIELFEGLKAFRGIDGKVRLFRVADNARLTDGFYFSQSWELVYQKQNRCLIALSPALKGF